jgi:hypothetical protein
MDAAPSLAALLQPHFSNTRQFVLLIFKLTLAGETVIAFF